MQTPSLAQLKKEIQTLPYPVVVDICIRLAKYKKENKELLNYLLFQSHDEQQFIDIGKKLMDELFAEVNMTHVYFAKKTIRKILRSINKLAKYSGKPQTTVELLIYFLNHLRKLEQLLYQSNQVMGLYTTQLKKIKKELTKLHEDIQYDYLKEIKDLS
jgi:hypothetical protein